MLTSQVFKSRTGLHYTLRLTNKGVSSLPSSIKAESFPDESTALHFVHSLQVPLFFWENLAQDNSFFNYHNWNQANPWISIESYIAQALIQGSVQVFQSTPISVLNESRQLRSFKDTSGKSFELQPAASLLVNATADVQPVNNKVSAEKILQDLGITAESSQNLHKSLNLPANSGTSVEALISALVKGDIVLTQQAEALKPSTGQDFVETVFEAPKSAAEPPPAETNSTTAPSTEEKEPVLDEKATAEVMTQAAEDGTPFCEECEKAKDDKKAA